MAGHDMLSNEILDDALRTEVADACNVLVQQIEDVYELTAMQLGMFAESTKCDGAYQTLSVSSLEASMDEERFCAALRQVYRANAVLRTRIAECTRGLVQVVIDEDLEIHRSSDGLEQYLEGERNRNMWLGTPLSTVAIVERKLVCLTHHATRDDSALQLFMSDVMRAYLNDPAIQRTPFKDYVQFCSNIDQTAAEEFWGFQFDGPSAIYPIVTLGQIASAVAVVSSSVAISQAGPVPTALLPSYIEAAWALTSESYTSSHCVAFGNVLSGRSPSSAGLESTLGPTIVMAPVQVVMQPNMTVQQLIRERTEARRRLLSSSALQYGLARISRVSADAKAACQFQTVLNIRSRGVEDPYSVLGITLDYVYDAPQPYGLSLQCTINTAEIHIEAHHDVRVLPERQMQRVLQQLQHFLRLLIRAPLQLELSQIPRLNPKDRQQLLQWNKNIPTYADRTLHDAFREHVKSLAPESLAVEAPDGTLTYQQLNTLSDSLAAELHRQGISAGSAVPIHFEKSKWAIVAVVAILKAGAACVPLAPEHPRMRKELIIKNTRATVLLTSRTHYLECLNLVASVLAVDENAIQSFRGLGNINASVSSDQAAYILHTSGSTGTPKGVVLEHRNLVTSLMAYSERLGLAEVANPRVLQFAAFVWDSSIAEIWMALLLGGTVCIPSEIEREATLVEYINEHRIDWMSLTPSMLRTLAPGDVPGLRFLCSVGEPIHPSAAGLWGSREGLRFFNAWGPTEASVCSTLAELTPKSPNSTAIGTPVGCGIWIVDPQDVNKLLPIGAVGEMIIDGPGVTRYLGEDAKIAAAFITPPAWAPRRPRGHLYRTGDLARYEADGSLSFIGRRDNQVKIRGQRFDLSEVETALSACEAVHEAVAIKHDKGLVAVISLSEDSGTGKILDLVADEIVKLHGRHIFDDVQQRLPSYMLPSAWLFVHRLPLSQSHKLDRVAVADWLSHQNIEAAQMELLSGTDGPLTPPSAPHELLLQKIWTCVLDLPPTKVGRESSFIGLGGDSITGMQVVSRCRRQGVSLKMSDMLRSKSLTQAAKHCSSLDSSKAIARGPANAKRTIAAEAAAHVAAELQLDLFNILDAYPCTPVQEGILLSQARGEGSDYMASFAMKVTGVVVDTTRLLTAWSTVCRALPILRTVSCSTSTGDGFQQVVLDDPQLVTDVVALDVDFGTAFTGWTTPTFAPSQPRHSLSIMQRSSNETYMVLDIDHVLYDATSVDLMVAALKEAYDSGIVPPRTGPELVDYVSWAQSQRAVDIDYWKTHLGDVRPCLVPTTRAGHSRSTLKVDIPYHDAATLARLCSDQNVTVTDAVQTAWSIVLQLLTGQIRVCFGSLYSGRDVFEGANEIVGPLISMLTCKAEITSQTTIQGLLNILQYVFAESLQHSACSLGDVLGSLNLDGPLFNTSLTVQHVSPEPTASSCGLMLEPVAGELTTEYPLSVNVSHSKGYFHAEIVYNSAHVSTSFASYIAEAMSSALTMMITDPNQLVASFAREAHHPMYQTDPFSLVDGAGAELLKAKAASQCEVSPRHIKNIFPCSPTQRERFLASLDHGEDLMSQHVFQLHPDADLGRLQKAWSTIHLAVPALCTRILDQADYQAIVVTKPQWTEDDDLDTFVEWDRSIRVRYGGPLSRLGLVEQSDGKSYVIWSVHAGIADSYTVDRVLQAVERTYLGETPTPTPTMSPFVDYLSMRNMVTGADRYWREKFEGLGEAAYFPSDTQRDGLASVIRKESMTLATAPSEDSRDITPALLQAAWALCLSRRSGATQVLFGIQLDARDAIKDLESTPGCLTTLTPLAVQVQPNYSVENLVAEVDNQMIGTQPYAHIGLENIRSASRNAGRACAFRNILAVVGRKSPRTHAIAAMQTCIESDRDMKIPLAITCEVGKDEIKLIAKCDQSVLSAQDIRLLLQQFEHAITQLSISSNQKLQLSQLQSLCGHEMSLLRSWNAITPLPAETCIHDQFREIAFSQPQRTAVSSWDQELDYATLDQLSDRLAQKLQQEGVRPETIVPMFCEKSSVAIICCLAIVKAGGALLPLDPQHPRERLATVMKACGARIAVSSSILRDKVNQLCDPVVVVDMAYLVQLPAAYDNHLPVVTPSSACAVIYTSGSTGTPKGIVLSHSSFSTAISAHRLGFGITATTRTLQFVNFVFDVALHDIFMTLLSGGCVCIPTQAELAEDLAGAINRTKATYACMTPTLASLMSPSEVPTLGTLVLGGEQMSAETVAVWKDHVRLVNGYGPAEVSGVSSTRLQDGVIDNRDIGFPSGGRYWVVNPDNHDGLVPIGCIGELLVEGPIVARGYVSDERKTNAAFIKAPIWTQRFPSVSFTKRWYLTGDLVSQSTDGSCFFRGRKDNMIKLRGLRIELGEIEHRVRAICEATWQVIAQVIRPAGQDQEAFLAVVYSTNNSSSGHSNDDLGLLPPVKNEVISLRTTLKETLPAYMVPDIWIHLKQLPWTTTGKIDRKRVRNLLSGLSTACLSTYNALSEIDPGEIEPVVTQMSLNEIAMQQVWSKVLSIPASAICTSDNFFAKGGNSIRAIRLVAAAREKGLKLTAADIFRKPVLQDMAGVAKNVERTQDSLMVPPFSLLHHPVDEGMVRRKVATACNVDATQVEDVFSCTPLQEGLLALATKRPGDYVMRIDCQLRTEVDVDNFKAAYENVASSAPILRTRITDLPGQGLVQVVIKKPVEWEDVDALRDSSALRQFTIGTPLSRVGLKQENGKASLTWFLHHSVYDGWSMSLLLRLIEDAYHKRPLEVVPFQQLICSMPNPDSELSTTFWRTQFAGLEATQFPALPSATYIPRASSVLQRSLKRLRGPVEGASLSSLIRTAWALLISSYTNAAEAIFGAVTTGRQADVPGIDRIVGPTIATVPVRIVVDRQQSIASLLDNVQRQAVEMASFEQTGLQHIARLSREAQEACRFQTLLLVQPPVEHAEVAPGGSLFLTSSVVHTAQEVHTFSNYAIMLECEEYDAGELSITYSFDADVVEEDQMTRIAQTFEHVLRQICDPGAKAEIITIADIETVSPEDLDDIWRLNGSVPEAINLPVHELLLDVFQRQPNKTAICAWDGDFTYSELNVLSSRLAQRLYGLGVKSEMAVALYFEKSKWMSVAALAVMKAGGMSVMLDTTQPQERLSSIIQQVRPSWLLSSSSCHETAKALVDVPVLSVDAELFDKQSLMSLTLPVVHPASAIYCVATSGSTGSPKGVVCTHSNISSALRHQADAIGPTSRVLDLSSYAFDIAWYNLLHTLFAGGCLCVPSERDRIHDISGAISRLNPTFVNVTPTVAEMFDENALEHLHTIELIGERASETLLARLKARVPFVRNTYGPSETTSMVCVSKDFRETSHIGRGIGAVTWIVDPNTGALAPLSGIGELWLEGPLLGRGYINDIEQTSAVFVEDPPFLTTGVPGRHPGRSGRMYRTGDLVKYESDRSITYLGRQDGQVKINGQRIELGEVEHHVRLLLEPDTRIVAQVVTPLDTQKPTLVIFVVPGGGENMSMEELQDVVAAQTSAVKQKLAESGDLLQCMLPSAFIPLAEIPLTATGKTDRRRLRELGASLELRHVGAEKTEEVIEPSTQTERTLRRLWAEVFEISESSISVTASFVQLGGDSITAMRLASLAQHESLSLTVPNILSRPRLDDMASHAELISNEVNEGGSQLAHDAPTYPDKWAHQSVWLKQDNIESIAHVLDSQAWMLAAGDLDRRGFHNTYRLTSEYGLDPERLLQACREVVRKEPILRTVFVQHGREIFQVVLRRSPVEQVFLNARDAVSLPGLRQAKDLPQFHVVTSGSNKVRLEIRIHHALYDAFSMNMILQDISAAYLGRAMSPRPHYHSWLSYMRGLETNSATDHWTQLLQGSSMTCLAPSQPVERCTAAESSLEFSLTAESLQADGVTPANVFKAAWATVLSQAVQSSDVVFSEVQAVRSATFPGIDAVCGPSVNILPVRVKLGEHVTSNALAMHIQAQSLEATPYHHLGIRSIIKDCTDWPPWTRFSSIMIFQNHKALQADCEIGGVSCQLEQISHNGDSADVWVVAMPDGDQVKVQLMFSPERVPMTQARWLSERLEMVMDAFAKRINLEQIHDMISILPTYEMPPALTSVDNSAGSGNVTIAREHIDLVRKAWDCIAVAKRNSCDADEHEPLWSRHGADLVAAYLLSEYYNSQGFSVTTNDIIGHPSQAEQVKLLSSRDQTGVQNDM